MTYKQVCSAAHKVTAGGDQTERGEVIRAQTSGG